MADPVPLESASRQEEPLRALFDRAASGILLVGESGLCRDANPALCALLGYRREEIVGQPLSRFIPPGHEAARRQLSEAGEWHGELPVFGKDGQPVLLEWHVSTYTEPGTRLAIVNEIRGRSGTEAALRASEERFRVAQRAAGMGTWDWNLRTGEVVWSEGIYALLGLEADSEAPSFERWTELVHPEDRERVLRGAEVALARGGDYWSEFRVVRPDGAVRWLASIGRVEPGEDGKPERMLGVNIDITDRKLAERAVAASEREFRTIFELAGSGKAQADAATGRYVRVNSRFCEITGYSEAELLGRDFRELTHPEDRAQDMEAIEPVLRGERDHWQVEKRYLRKDGQVVWVIVTGSLIRDEEGRPLRSVSTIHDITERKLAEQALQRREEQLRLIMNAVPALISYIDASYHYRLVNNTYERWFGRSPEQMRGRHVREVLGEAAWEVVRPYMEQALAGEEVTYEQQLPYHHAGARWVQVTYTPDRDADDRVAGFVVLVNDLSERRQAEEALREADRRKDEFIDVLAHELRNPLAPIRNALHLLQLQGGSPAAVERLQGMMDRQVRHMTRLIDDLLDVSRISQGKIRLQRERLDLRQLVRVTLDDHRGALDSHGLTVEMELPESPVWVMGDSTRLTQVLDNLLENTRKFTDRGGTIRVRLRPEESGEQVVMTVADTGMGIEPEMLSRLFDVFSQADHSLDRSRGGLGLGLALVKGLVELHGGTVQARSEGIGQGAEFLIRLPREPEPPALASSSVSPAPCEQGQHILIIEDNPDAAESLRMLLEAYGCQVTLAPSGPVGLEAAHRDRPDVILCDIGLPGMDGYEVARALRQEPGTSDIRLIALTGYGQEEDIRQAHEAGFDAHLTKPAAPERLFQALQESSGRPGGEGRR